MIDGINEDHESDGSSASEGLGFFTRVTDPQLFQKIEAKAKAKKYFTDRVTSERVSVRLSDIALVVSPTQSLAFVSHVRPTRAGTTGTRGFKASGPLCVDLSADAIVAEVAEDYREEIRRGFSEPSLRPSMPTWKAIWLAIKRLCPGLAAELRQIEQLRFDDSFEFDEDSNDEQVFYEKDAIGVALDVAGISFSGVFAGVSEARQQDRHLIEALCGNPTEDVIINHDVHTFPEYIRESDQLHACEFVQHGRRLKVFNVNRRPAERVLGVDLIYHNVSYDAFTFVQYKMLQREGSSQLPAWRYRPDRQFDEEVTRMHSARSAFRVGAPKAPDLFRFGEDPFFFKLCRRQHLKVNSGQLASGVYLNLTHCDLILSGLQSGAPRVLEPGKNVGRWLNRTQFTDLVARGWIGTINLTSNALATYVSDALESRRSVLIAVGESSRVDVNADDDGETYHD